MVFDSYDTKSKFATFTCRSKTRKRDLGICDAYRQLHPTCYLEQSENEFPSGAFDFYYQSKALIDFRNRDVLSEKLRLCNRIGGPIYCRPILSCRNKVRSGDDKK